MAPPPDPLGPCSKEQLQAEAVYQGQLDSFNKCIKKVIKRDHEVQGMSLSKAAENAAAECASKRPKPGSNIPQCVHIIERARQYLNGLREWCHSNPKECMLQNEAADNWANKCRAPLLVKVMPAWQIECRKNNRELLVEQKYIDGLILSECGPRIPPKFVHNLEEYLYSGTTNGDRDWGKVAPSEEVGIRKEAKVVPETPPTNK